jgi:hypothetical protein
MHTMLFDVKGVKRGSGEKVNVRVQAPDERTAGWSAIDRGIDVVSITPVDAPPPAPPRPVLPPRRPPHPAVRKIARIVVLASAVLLPILTVPLIRAHMEYARVSERAELKRRTPRGDQWSVAYRNLNDAERHEADMLGALYRLWATAGAAVVMLFVAVALQPFRRDETPSPQRARLAIANCDNVRANL